MDLIYLAAGNSTRFGSNKLLYKLNEKYMYRYGLEVMMELQQEYLIENIVLVTQYEEIVQDMEKCFPGIIIVRNLHPEQGISRSIFLGVEKLIEMRRNCGKTGEMQMEILNGHEDRFAHSGKYHLKKEGCMFAVADQPYLTVESLRNMILCWENSDKGIAISSHGERMGNPVIFSGKYYEELSNLKGDVGGKQVIKKHLDDVQMFEMPASELKDLDSPTEICE